MKPIITYDILFKLLKQEAPKRIQEYQELKERTLKELLQIRNQINEYLIIIESNLRIVISQIEQNDILIPFYYKLIQIENKNSNNYEEIFSQLENSVDFKPSPTYGQFEFNQNPVQDSLQHKRNRMMASLLQVKQMVESISQLGCDYNDSIKNEVGQRKKVKLETQTQLTEEDQGIKEIDTQNINFQLTENLEGHQGAIQAVAISHDDRYIASVSSHQNPQVILWDLQARTILKQYKGVQNVKDLAFSKNNLRLAVAGYYNLSPNDICIYNIGDLSKDDPIEVINRNLKDNVTVFRMIFTQSSSQLISTKTDKTITVWDICERQEISRIECANWIYGLCISDNEELIGCCCLGGLAYLWDSESLTSLTEKVKWQAHTSYSCCIEFINNSTVVLTSSTSEIRFWLVEDLLKCRWTCLKQIQSDHGNNYIWKVKALPRQNTEVIIASQGSAIRIYQAEPTEFKQVIDIGCVTPNGSLFAVTSDFQIIATVAQESNLRIYQQK